MISNSQRYLANFTMTPAKKALCSITGILARATPFYLLYKVCTYMCSDEYRHFIKKRANKKYISIGKFACASTILSFTYFIFLHSIYKKSFDNSTYGYFMRSFELSFLSVYGGLIMGGFSWFWYNDYRRI